MSQVQNFTCVQGADLVFALNYKEGTTVADAVLVDLSSGYSVRMDLVVPTTKQRVYTFNSGSITDVDPFTSGSQADSVVEGALTSGSDGKGNIQITIPRSLTLPGGVVYDNFTAGVETFNYDIFLRNTVTNKQAKLLTGTITIGESWTLWL
jgi:hypothetical protein